MSNESHLWKPVVPFEPVATDSYPNGGEWIAQVKWDGVRVLVYADRGQVRLFNRRLNERTMQYPELAQTSDYCRSDTFVLDGEMIALEGDKPSFHQVMRRDGVRKAVSAAAARREVPVVYMVFDVLYADGEWVTARPLRERQALLERLVKPGPHVQAVRSETSLRGLYEAVDKLELEGVVFKDLNSAYEIGGKDKRWRKKKRFRDLVAVVGGVTYRDNLVNALLLGLYDAEGRLWYIGHAGAGAFTQNDWRHMTREAARLRTADRPFANMPVRSRDAVWLRPLLTVKTNYMSWTPDMALRQPVLQSFTDLPPEACTFQSQAPDLIRKEEP